MPRHAMQRRRRAEARAALPALRRLGEAFTFNSRSVVAIDAGRYRNGQVRIDIVDERTGSTVAIATAPDDCFRVARGQVLLSDAGASRGIVAALEKAGVVADTGRMVDDAPFGRLHVCKLIAQVTS